MLLKWIIGAVCLYILTLIFPGFHIEGVVTALVAAAVLGLVNLVVKPLLHLISLPITILTLGLFSLVINGFSLYLASWIVPGFEISNFFTAFFAALVLSVLNALLRPGDN
ncbi:MAG: phage holin family protein [Defluviitaleaceae bacterium]|nr:phage holin family protein [Defluviitaleaceae bacterium]MCL2238521.1 phage holin family protein [Defluviitaleaceae bacterium]